MNTNQRMGDPREAGGNINTPPPPSVVVRKLVFSLNT